MRQASLLVLFLVLTLCQCGHVLALGMEDFGKRALNERDYVDWPGIMPIVNHPGRVYHYWVNGHEEFYFAGDTDALNDVLQRFAQVQIKSHEVVLRPGPGITHSFLIVNAKEPQRTIPFNWNLSINGGIARTQTQADQGNKIWSGSPMLNIYVGGDIKLERLQVPAGVKLLELADLKLRYRQAILTSTDHTVSGWGCGELANLDPYDDWSLKTIVQMLKDPDDWVKLNAAGALAKFGKKAESVIPAMRQAMETTSQQLKERLRQTIEKIEQSPDASMAEREHIEMLESISQYVHKITAPQEPSTAP